MNTITKRTEVMEGADLDGRKGLQHIERTEEALSSVEIGESARGEVSIKSVKVYHASVEMAGTLALVEYHRLKAAMKEDHS